jgi:5-deoxy-glucuronate isomerase
VKPRYHLHPADLVETKNPGELGLAFTSVRRIEASPGRSTSVKTTNTEMCLVVIKGEADFVCRLPASAAEKNRGPEKGRAVFKDMIFLPPDSSADISGKAVLMAYEAPSELGADYAHIRFKDIDADPATHKKYGKTETGCLRDVWNYVDSGFRCSRLMMGICEGRAGGWTAWPPHEHGNEREEVYVYFDMGLSFGVQCVYEDLASPVGAFIVREGDLVSIPKGYHPNVGCPAGRINYIYCMTAKVPGERNFMDLRIQKEYGEKFE